jgi:glycosyltransferase involved in cell wall biosynthesis
MHVTGVWQPTSIPACREARRQGIPYVMSPRGALSAYSFAQKRLKKALYWWGWERRHLHEAAAVHYTALAEQEECARLRPRAPGFVVPNGIDLRAWRADPEGARAWRTRHGLETADRVFLNSGRLHHKKGLELLIEAAKGLPANRRWRLVFAGPDEDGTGGRLRELARAAGLGERLIFTGALDTRELAAVYSAADLFLFPSLNENFGNVAIEALACGTSLVLSPEVGCRRELAGVAGVTVRSRVAAEWRTEMAGALDRAPLAADLLRARRRELELRYSPDAVAAAMEEAYGQVLAKRRAAGAPNR